MMNFDTSLLRQEKPMQSLKCSNISFLYSMSILIILSCILGVSNYVLSTQDTDILKIIASSILPITIPGDSSQSKLNEISSKKSSFLSSLRNIERPNNRSSAALLIKARLAKNNSSVAFSNSHPKKDLFPSPSSKDLVSTEADRSLRPKRYSTENPSGMLSFYSTTKISTLSTRRQPRPGSTARSPENFSSSTHQSYTTSILLSPKPKQSPRTIPTVLLSRRLRKDPSPKTSLSPTESPTLIPSQYHGDTVSSMPSFSSTIYQTSTEALSIDRNERPSIEPFVEEKTSYASTALPSKHRSLISSKKSSFVQANASNVTMKVPLAPLKEYTVSVLMVLSECDMLEGTSVFDWQDATTEFLTQKILSRYGNEDLMQMYVFTKIQSQAITTEDVGQHRRKILILNEKDSLLQQRIKSDEGDNAMHRKEKVNDNFLRKLGAKSLSLSFIVGFSVRSLQDDHDVHLYVYDSFDSFADVTEYIAVLRDTRNPAFQKISSVTTRVMEHMDGVLKKEDREQTILIAAGISIGGVGFLYLLSRLVRTLCWERGGKNIRTTKDSDNWKPNDHENENDTRISRIVRTNTIDGDISTLGPPNSTVEEECQNIDVEEDGSLPTLDYEAVDREDNLSVVDSWSIVSDVDTKTNSFLEDYCTISRKDSLFTDDSSLERLYGDQAEILEVMAPPGLVGLEMNSSHGGIPTVSRVKENSVLAGTVQVGDRLISVNNFDTTEMNARSVSMLISHFKTIRRYLVFIRAKAT